MPWVAGDEADGPLDHFNTVRSFAKWPSVPKDMIEHAISQVTKCRDARLGGTIHNLQDIWGSDPGNVWAVGDGETILRWSP